MHCKTNMKIVGSGQWGVGSKTETTEKVRFSRKKGCDLGTVRLSNALFMRLRNRPHVEALFVPGVPDVAVNKILVRG